MLICIFCYVNEEMIFMEGEVSIIILTTQDLTFIADITLIILLQNI